MSWAAAGETGACNLRLRCVLHTEGGVSDSGKFAAAPDNHGV